MSETPRDPNEPGGHEEWLPDDPATEDVAPPAAQEPAFDQGAIERERNRKAQEAASAGIAVTSEAWSAARVTQALLRCRPLIEPVTLSTLPTGHDAAWT